jgi:hypothetical protein
LHEEGERDRQEGQGLRGFGRRSAAAAASAAAALALTSLGCGGGTAVAPAVGATPRVELTIAIAASPRPGAPVRTWVLRCGPVGGDWPRVASACAALGPRTLRPIGAETRDLVPIGRRPLRLAGAAFGRPVSLYFPAQGSSTRRLRFESIQRALGLDR